MSSQNVNYGIISQITNFLVLPILLCLEEDHSLNLCGKVCWELVLLQIYVVQVFLYVWSTVYIHMQIVVHVPYVV